MTDTLPPGQPSPWVARFAPLVPQGEVLDLACGSGRHARHFAALGHPVLAVDRDPQALALAAAGQGVQAQLCDLEVPDFAWPFGPARFAGMVVTNYLHRPLLDALVGSMKPDGVLIYETFSRWAARRRRWCSGCAPADPDLPRNSDCWPRHGLEMRNKRVTMNHGGGLSATILVLFTSIKS